MQSLKVATTMRLLIEGFLRRGRLRVIFFCGRAIFWRVRHYRGECLSIFCGTRFSAVVTNMALNIKV